MMGMNDTSMMMGGMAMTFYSSTEVTLLFNAWHTRTVGQYVGALVAVLLMGIGRQALVWVRKQLPFWFAAGIFTACKDADAFYPLASKPLTYGTAPDKSAGSGSASQQCCCDDAGDETADASDGDNDHSKAPGSDRAANARRISNDAPDAVVVVRPMEVATSLDGAAGTARGGIGFNASTGASLNEFKTASDPQYSKAVTGNATPVGIELRCFGGRTASPMQVLRNRPADLALLRAVDGVLHTIVTAVAFFNMLVAMTYNAGIFVSICVGEGLGYYLFSPFVLVQWDGTKPQRLSGDTAED